MRPQVGQVINNKYRLNRLIGDGGMGTVYEARHEMLGTLVALKFLHPELTRRTGLVQRFLQEAKVSAQIQSPHVVRVMDVDQTPDGLAFIVLEYLEGRTLQTLYEDLYKAGQRLSYADALEYSMQMIEGVEAAHKTGIVHRDLKPDNVMITTGPKGAPLLKLLDFGIAKLKVSGEMEKGLTRPGVIMGTPEYMAPEQAYSADAVDSRADIFSLGVMMFEMLAGRRPVGGDDPQQIAAAYLAGQIARIEDLAPGIAPELAAAVHKAMAPLAKNRFDSVSELRDAIEPFALAVRPVQPSRVSLSATPTPAPASPMMAPGPATNLPEEAPRAVPKTLPPEDEEPAAIAHRASGTPLGGFAALNALGPVNMAATTANPPVAVSGFGSTEFATPLTPLAPAAVDLSPRPGGTHVGNGGGYGGGSATAAGAPAYGAEFAGTAPMEQPYGATVGMRGSSGATVSALPPQPRRSGGRGPSLVLVLLLAIGVAGAVVGGVYAANQYAKVEDHNDAPIAITPASTVRSDPPPTGATTPPVVAPPVTVRPPVVAPPHPTTPTTPTTPKPGASTTPTTLPTVPTALIIPSAFPTAFPNPFGIPNPFQPPGAPTQQPQQQTPPSSPTTPAPTTPAPTSTGRPKIIFGPKSGMNEPVRPHPHTTILPRRRG
jgi:serine/threonine-protein kinase